MHFVFHSFSSRSLASKWYSNPRPQCSAVFALYSNVSHGEILSTNTSCPSSVACKIRGSSTSSLRTNCSLDDLYCISFATCCLALLECLNRTFSTNPTWEYKVGFLQWQGETQGGFSAANSTSPLPDMWCKESLNNVFVCLKECSEQSSLKMLVFIYGSLGSCNCNISLCKLHIVAQVSFTSLQEKVLSNLPVPYCKTQWWEVKH